MPPGRPRSTTCAACGVTKTPENCGKYQRGRYISYAAYCRQCESDRVTRRNIKKMGNRERAAAIARYQHIIDLLKEADQCPTTSK